jgi:hypothetical protein
MDLLVTKLCVKAHIVHDIFTNRLWKSSHDVLHLVWSVCLTKHHAMKAYWGIEGIDPRIL